MTKQFSFSGWEHKALPHYKERLNKAESREDVKNAFVQKVQDLLTDVLDGTLRMEPEDIELAPNSDILYRISGRLRTHESLQSWWAESDLPHVIRRLAYSAARRYKHLEKNPGKTQLKIRRSAWAA